MPARCFRNRPPVWRHPEPRGDGGVAPTRRCRFSYLHPGIGYQACSAGKKPAATGDSRACDAGRKTCGYGGQPSTRRTRRTHGDGGYGGVAPTRRCRFSYLHDGIGYRACDAGKKPAATGDGQARVAGKKPAATGDSQARAARNAPTATAAPCGVALARRCRFSYLHPGIGYQACSAGRKTGVCHGGFSSYNRLKRLFDTR